MNEPDRSSKHASRSSRASGSAGKDAADGPQGRRRSSTWVGASKGAGASKGGSGAKASGASPGASSRKAPSAARHTSERTDRGTSRTASAGAGAAGAAAQRRSAARASSSRRRKRQRRPGFWGGVAGALNYPRAKGRGALAWLPSLRMWIAAFALVVLLGAGGAAWLYSTIDVPKPNDVALAQTSTVYFADGKTKMGTFSDINRTILPADEIPDSMKEALVASEDSTFYENRGISPRGILRAFINNIRGGSRQGASTITQQYVSNYYTSKSRGDYAAKVREMVMAIKIDQELPKDEIISRYLNTIYFGRGAYGVQAAAQAYFGKDAKDLNPSESAMLVGLIPGPSLYDPAVNEQKSQQLWKRVIDREVNTTKTLTPQQADALKFPQTIKPRRKNNLGGPNGYLLKMTENELRKQGFSDDAIQAGGFTIISTIDKDVQDDTVQAIDNLPPDRPKNNRVGTVTIDPRTGAIRALYGGHDYVTQGRSDATQSHMQAGSIFKTFTLIAALEQGYSLYSTFDGNSPASFPGWKVNNFSKISYGRVNLIEATTNSINTAYAELNVDMGPKHTKEAAVQLGIPENTPGLGDDASNVLGSASPTVLNMATAYSTIAAGGIHRTPHIVQEVKRPDGSVRYKAKDDGKRVLDEKYATNATVALQGPPSDGSARYVGNNMNGRPVAGKTGTSESFRSAWFVGFTPQLVTAVGMFQPSADGRSEEQLTPFGGERQITGGTFPTRIWVDIMKPALDGKEKLDFPDAVSTRRSRSSDRSDSEGSGAARTSRPRTRAPRTTQAPTTQAPTTEAPKPTTQEPTTQAPTTQAPTTEAPKPTTEAPKPKTEAPKPKEPAPKPKETAPKQEQPKPRDTAPGAGAEKRNTTTQNGAGAGTGGRTGTSKTVDEAPKQGAGQRG